MRHFGRFATRGFKDLTDKANAITNNRLLMIELGYIKENDPEAKSLIKFIALEYKMGLECMFGSWNYSDESKHAISKGILNKDSIINFKNYESTAITFNR